MVTVIQDLNIDTANNLLQQFKGNEALIVMYSPTFRRLVINLYNLYGSGEVLYLTLAGCEHIKGPFNWDNANISLTDVPDPRGGRLTMVSDNTAGFELTANAGFILFHGPANEFGDTFDNFIDWDKAIIGPNPGQDTH